ncbi:hypothetical protein AX16_002537 [Volvariella volvacea WC 439]|nr:hypothetical protein AX16_002537 [Volvariella volvacea WC 439]
MEDNSNNNTECISTNHSASTFVTSLYPDILSRIFLVVAESAEWNYRDYVPQTSHVCAYWRAVALQTYQLWNRFVLRDPKSLDRPWTQERLKRTKSSSIDLTVHPYDGLTLASIPDTHRVRSLKIEGSEHRQRSRWRLIEDLLQSFFSISNSNLQFLTISYRRFPIPTDSLQLSSGLFQGHAPNLVYLCLDGCIPQDWNALSHLSSLKVVELPELYGPPPLEELSRIPHLENLNINFARSATTSVPHANTIHFFSLREFTLTGLTAVMMRNILGSIHLPLCINIKFECVDGSEQDFADLKPILIRFLSTGTPVLSTIPLDCMALLDGSIAVVTADSHNLKHPQHSCDCTSAAEIMATSDEISILFDAGSRTTKSFITNDIVLPLALCFNCSDIRYFLWSPGSDVTLDHRLSSRMKELRVMDAVVAEPSLLEDLEHWQEDVSLTQGDPGPDDERLPSALCPKLATLNIIHPNAMDMDVGTPSPDDTAGFYNGLLDKLTRRSRLLGRPLKTLFIHGFDHLGEPERMGLEAVAEEVYIR